MGYVPREWRGINNFFLNYFGNFQVGGGVTLLGGRTTWGKGKEWSVIMREKDGR
jgi:hypothetical protein